MKPKISTGYLTPQVKKTVRNGSKRLSISKVNDGAGEINFDQELFQDLMKCPEKKKLVLQLLSSNKEAIKKYTKEKAEGSVGKLKSKSIQKGLESPSALLRRRALKEMSSNPGSSNRSDISRADSRSSNVSSNITTSSTPSTPFENILKGVNAYVEIKSRHNEDRSASVKAVLQSMGAIILEDFSRKVTHVVFKDGCYSTFQKARLLKVHLVSILWVEFCRKSMQRQDEKQFPALKSGFDDETIVCSQIQKEYEEIVRHEYRKSISQGTPLPTTQSLINRRRTLFTPSVSPENGNTSFHTANESSHKLSDKENTPGILTTIIDRDIEKTRISNSDMEITNIGLENNSFPLKPLCSTNINMEDSEIFTIRTPSRSHSSKNDSTSFNRRKNINRAQLASVRSLSDSLDNDKFKEDSSTRTSNRSTNMSNDSLLVTSKNSTKESCSSLEHSSESLILGRKAAKSRKKGPTPSSYEVSERRGSAKSELNRSSNCNVKKYDELRTSSNEQFTNTISMPSLKLHSSDSTTSMPPLQISSEKASLNGPSKLIVQDTGSMSALQVSSDHQVFIGSTIIFPTPRKNSSKTTETDVSMSALRVSSEKPSDNTISMSKLQLTSETNSKLVCSSSDLSHNGLKNYDLGTRLNHSNGSLTKHLVERLSNDLYISRETDISGMSDESEIISPVKNRSRILEVRRINDENEPVIKKFSVKVMKSPEQEDTCPTKTRRRRKTLGVSRKLPTRERTTSLNPQIKKPNDYNSELQNPKSATVLPRKAGRKLYNPNDSVSLSDVDDDKEREERFQSRKRKSDEGMNPLEFLNDFNQSLIVPASENEACEVLSSPKTARKPRKKKDETIIFDSSVDEQKELMDELLNGGKGSNIQQKSCKIPVRRKSMRIQKSQVSVNNVGVPETKVRLRPVSPVNRRSTLEFMSPVEFDSTRKKMKKMEKRLPTIVCTKLHKADVQLFMKIVKKLGKFNIQDQVGERTTHLVAGESKRTINMLRAVARGCWVVSFQWVLQSLEAGKWLPEDQFEVTDFAPVVQKSHLERQAFGPKHTLDVFENCPPIYVAPSTNPHCWDLKELITTCKGKIVTSRRKAKIVVGQYVKQDNTVCVNEFWILDSITFYRKMPFKQKYLISATKKQSLVSDN
ncbi:microcephalin [Euwallacea similis]|uniref:microcephalin n=1 Tax=Euwallacea similis TaxID=1736056 RepID=UPI00344F67DB